MIKTFIGLLGMTLILIAFILDEFSKNYHQNSMLFNILNITGASLLIIYSLFLNSIPFFILNSVWCLGSLIKIIVLLKKKSYKK